MFLLKIASRSIVGLDLGLDWLGSWLDCSDNHRLLLFDNSSDCPNWNRFSNCDSALWSYRACPVQPGCLVWVYFASCSNSWQTLAEMSRYILYLSEHPPMFVLTQINLWSIFTISKLVRTTSKSRVTIHYFKTSRTISKTRKLTWLKFLHNLSKSNR